MTFTFTIARIEIKNFITYSFVNQFFAFASAFLFIPLCLLLQTLASSLHLHLQFSCHFMYLVSLVLDIKLNSLRFIFLTTSRIHIFTYGSLILLQLPLHLLILTL